MSPASTATVQSALFEAPAAPKRSRPVASTAVLFVLAEVAMLIDDHHDDGIGAPAIGFRNRTVQFAVNHGWLTRSYVGDSDIEQGPHRLHVTAAGRNQLAADAARCHEGARGLGIAEYVRIRHGVAPASQNVDVA